MNKTLTILILSLTASAEFQIQAMQTNNTYHQNKYAFIRPEYAAFGLATASLAGACAAKYKNNAMLEQHRIAYNTARYAKRLETAEGNKAFKEETKNVNHKARKPYKIATYGLGISSVLSFVFGGWLLYKNNCTIKS